MLEEVCASDLFSRDELPSPSNEQRQPPRNIAGVGEQLGLLAEGNGLIRNTRTNRFPSVASRQTPCPRQPFWGHALRGVYALHEVRWSTEPAWSTAPHGACSRADTRVRDCGWSFIPAGNQSAHLRHDHRYQSSI